MNIVKRTLNAIFDWDATRPSKDRANHFIPNANDAKTELSSYDRKQLLRFSRWLYKNSGLVYGTIGDIACYSVGTGLLPQSQSKDDDWNDTTESRFRQWARFADITGRFTLRELCNLWSKQISRDGEVFIVLTEDENGIEKIQTIPAHLVQSVGEHVPSNEHDGIVFDALNRPIFYIVAGKKIQSRNVIHLFDPHNCDSTRGIPSTAHAINNLFDIKEILAYEKKGVKLNSAIATTIKSTMPNEGVGMLGKLKPQSDDATKGLTLEAILGGGIIPRLQPNEELSAHHSNRPSPTFSGFITHFIRDYAVGERIPFEFVWDPSSLGGTANRFILEKAQRRFEERQETLIKALERIYTWWTARQIKKGLLQKADGWYNVEWQTPRKITVDAGRQSHANINDIKMGIKTIADDFAERGMDYRKELRQRAKEEKYIDDLANEYSVDRFRISQRTPNESDLHQSNKPEMKDNESA